MILYVAKNKHKPEQHDLGSVLCMRMLEHFPADAVRVQPCDDPSLPRPTWLIGTPTLYSETTGEVWRGHNALDQLQRRAIGLHQTRPAVQETRPATVQRPPSAEVNVEEHDPDDLWSSRIVEAEPEDEGPPKLTQEDLSRAIQARE